MSLRRSSQQSRCLDCLVHRDNCYCSEILNTDLKSKVSIIMYKKEQFLPSNTAMLSHKSLTNSELFIRGIKDQEIHASFIDEDNYHPLFLYPDDDAQELNSDFLNSIKKPINLIVPDGTWRQAKKIHSREKKISHIQKVKLSSCPKSIYPLRRQKMDIGLCTHEAIAYALEILEGNEAKDILLKNLETMISAHLKNRTLFEKQKQKMGYSIPNKV